MAAITLTMKKCHATEIVKGAKIYEARASSGKGVKNMVAGQTVAFHWYSGERLYVDVEAVLKFENVERMVHELGATALLPTCESVEECLAPSPCFMVGDQGNLHIFIPRTESLSDFYFWGQLSMPCIFLGFLRLLQEVYWGLYGKTAGMTVIHVVNPRLERNGPSKRHSKKRPAASMAENVRGP